MTVSVRADECGRISKGFFGEGEGRDGGIFDPAAVRDMIDESVVELVID